VNALEVLAIAAALISVGAMVMTLINLGVYRTPVKATSASGPSEVAAGELVSVCIPARNEEANIEAAVRSVLGQTHRNIDVLVYNDHSTDGTGEILQRLMSEDSRVRAVPVVTLEAGWNGKQFACWQMSQHAKGSRMLFTDADVRFEAACVERTLATARELGAHLLSTFPRQITGTLSESVVVPMIHFILFSYLPMPRMRRTMDPAASAACGQFLFCTREGYDASGGHSAFKDSMHDGVKMPRAFRRAGFRTDLFDGTDLCSCRMYDGFSATWRGFTKNAYEGLGSVVLLSFVTVLHAIGHLLPWGVLVAAIVGVSVSPLAVGLCVFAITWHLTQRLLLALRFRQEFIGALLHPVGIALMTAIQWQSFYLHITGQRAWKGRSLSATTA
jgi:hypothetical protein